MRGGKMAALREVPFRRYYGTVDAAPLFIMLAGAYLDRTGDLAAVQTLWPSIDLALSWIDQRTKDDGFVRYQRSTDGLANQGWKDTTTPSLMPTERWRVVRSHYARYRDMHLLHAWPGLPSLGA
jgi:glycogen debranching enzyme